MSGTHYKEEVVSAAGFYVGTKASKTQIATTGGQLMQKGTAVTPAAAQLNKSGYNTVMLPLGAINATTTFIAFIAPAACTLTQCLIATKDAIAKNDTDYWTVALTDKGAAGSGTDKIAEATTKATGGTAFGAYDAWSIGALDATHKVLAAGDVVTLSFTKAASATAFAEAAAMIEFVYS